MIDPNEEPDRAITQTDLRNVAVFSGGSRCLVYYTCAERI